MTGVAGVKPKFAVFLRADSFGRAMALAGFRSEYALAKAMGLNRASVKRVRTGESMPGPGFIAGALKALAPMVFEDLFEVDDNEE
ncbi:transcriptional regulator [Saccharothrix sp. HUAS TT1]|uniref:transcriptional regulator n=1 Tax=unclassified Saccharothrix TaxID=2593673 RepID=UPI00345B7825